jgi:predicted nucleic acid-binding protein
VIIVDSTVWIDYLGGIRTPHTDWLDRELDHQRLALTDLILCEVLQGIREDTVFKQVRDTLAQFDLIETGGEDLSIASAQNYRTLRARGLTVRKTVDCIIATACITQSHALLHNDRDFDSFEKHLGLQVIHP